MKPCAIAAVTMLLLLGCNTAGPSDGASVIEELRAQNIEVREIDRIAETALGVPMVVYAVPGGELQVYGYPTEDAAAAAAASISADGMKIGTSAPLWIGPPHFFRRGETIVNHLGEGADVLAALRRILGPPIAGR